MNPTPDIKDLTMRRGAVALAVLAALATSSACTSDSGVAKRNPPSTAAPTAPSDATSADTVSVSSAPPPATLPSSTLPSSTLPSSTLPTSTPTVSTTPPPTTSPKVQRLGAEAAVRAAALKGPHPGLTKYCSSGFSVEQTVRVLVGPSDRDRVEYAAVLVTCHMATGSSPADVTIVEPYPDRPAAVYRIVTATERYGRFSVLPQTISTTPGKVTVVFRGFEPSVSTAESSHFFKRTFTLGSTSASKGSYSVSKGPH